MTPERWQQVKEIFRSALERAPERRAAFLAEACRGHDSLRREVESLISSHEQSNHFIDSPAFQAAAEMLVDGQEFKPGETLGHYEIRSVLGEGGMGTVYLAEDRKLKRKVALKVLPADRGDEEARRRLLREAQAAAALDHPNICAIYEVDEASDRSYIAMQYVKGETLEARMAKERISVDDSLNIAVQVADALAEAHAHNIIHRDIKPSNIMLTARGQVKALDFGLAKTASSALVGPDEAETKRIFTTPGMIVGTVPYMSPEQLRGEPVDMRTDIFSFGVVVYEMLSGQRAFARASDAETIGAILHEQPPELSSIDSGIPKVLEDIVGKCLAKDADERYQTIEQVAHDLNIVRNGELVAVSIPAAPIGRAEITGATHRETVPTDIRAGRTTSSIEYLVSKVKYHRRSAILATACVIIAVAVSGYYFYFAKGGEAIDSIAVLPFVNVSNNADTEYLSDGISDSLINSLSQLPNLKKVIPFSSVLRYKGKQIDPQSVGRELNVRAVLTGRLVERGDDLLIIAELVDVRDNKRLWGAEYNRKSADILNLQGEIAREISEKLRLKLTGEQNERLAKPHTESAEAYQLYLQGRYYWHKGTDEARIKSGDYFQRAIERDPNYALAYAGLADYYAVMAFYGQMPPKEALRKSEEAAVKALAIDDALGEAHFSLAVVKAWYDWDWLGGEREFKRAIELNPEFADAESHGMYAFLLDGMGRFDEAVAEAKRSQRFQVVVGHILYNARRYDEAIEEYRKGLENNPDSIQAHLGLGEIYVKQGRYEEALAEMLKVRPLVKSPRHLARIGSVYAAAGKRDEAIKILEEVKGLTGQRYDLGAHIAAIYAALGNEDQAFAWLDNAYEAHNFELVELKVNPMFDTLRSDPRYVDLLGRMHLAP